MPHGSLLMALVLLAVVCAAASGGIKTVYVMQLAHLDIGFTATQREVGAKSAATIDAALALCDEDPDYKWTIESVWQLRQWMEGKSPARIEKLMARIREGRISLGAFFANYASALLGEEELHRALYDSSELKWRYKIPVETAIQNDLPGHSWAIPQALSRAGIRYFVGGTNLFIGGGADLPIPDHPFWWEGPDGSRVLTWLIFRWDRGEMAYLEGGANYGLHSLESAEEKLPGRLKALEEGGYPYDAILVLAGTGDNGDTNLDCTNTVRAWNAKHASPKLVIATPDEFFHHMERQYGDKFPVHRGDSSGLWEGVVCSVPAGRAKARAARELLPTAEKLASLATILNKTPYPAERLRKANRKLLEADEHSGGGGVWEDMMTPEQAHEEAETAYGYRRDAELLARAEVESAAKGLASSFAGQADTLMVFNALSWKRTTPARAPLPAKWKGRGVELIDLSTGKAVPCQVDLGSDELLFVAPELPAMGAKFFRIRAGASHLKGTGTAIENEFLRLRMDERGFPASLVEVKSGRELLNRTDGFRFGQVVVADRADMDSGKFPAADGDSVTIERGLDGPAAWSVVVTRKDSPSARTEYLLYKGIPWMEVRADFDRALIPPLGREKSGRVYEMAFPLALGAFEPRIDSAAGWLDLGKDKLPGAPRTFNLLRGADLVEAEGGIRFALRQGFHVDFGRPWSIFGGGYPPKSGTLMLRLLSVCDTARYKGNIDGPYVPEPGSSEVLRFDQAFAPYAGGFDPVGSAHFTGSYANPPVCRWLSPRSKGTLKAASGSFLDPGAENLAIVALKQAEDGSGFVIRVMEIAGKTATLKLHSDWLDVGKVERVSALEGPLPGSGAGIRLRPREIATLRFSLKRAE